MEIGNNKSKSLILDVAKGDQSDLQTFYQFGRNSAVGTSNEDIWSVGGTRTWLTAAETLDVVSTDANDTSAGTEARTIIIEGLDGSFNEISETVSLNGLTPVTTTNSFIRVNKAYVDDVGTYGADNKGRIDIDGTTSSTPMANIETARGFTEQTHFTVPAGKTLYINSIFVTGQVSFRGQLCWRPNADIVAAPFKARLRTIEFRDDYKMPMGQYLKFEEKTDVWFIASSDAGTPSVQINYFGILQTI